MSGYSFSPLIHFSNSNYDPLMEIEKIYSILQNDHWSILLQLGLSGLNDSQSMAPGLGAPFTIIYIESEKILILIPIPMVFQSSTIFILQNTLVFFLFHCNLLSISELTPFFIYSKTLLLCPLPMHLSMGLSKREALEPAQPPSFTPVFLLAHSPEQA